MALVQVADVIVPEIFAPYQQVLTEEKSELIRAGVLVRDTFLDQKMAGGGLTFNVPSWKDLDNDAENIASDNAISPYTATYVAAPVPKKISTLSEVAVRLNRNQLWQSSQLAGDLAGSDPMTAIANRTSAYWARRLQAAFISVMTGVFNDNAAPPSGSEHTQNDLTLDISGSSYDPGVTDFSAEAFLDAKQLMGDSQGDLSIIMVHSIVYNRMLKNDLIDFQRDSQGGQPIATFMGVRVIVDDGMTRSGLVCQSWLFGPGAVRMGVTTPDRPVHVDYVAGAGNGHGAEVLYNRVSWCLHPVGHAFVAGSIDDGGPANFDTTGSGTLASPDANTLAHAGSWARRYPERKQIKIARLITREG